MCIFLQEEICILFQISLKSVRKGENNTKVLVQVKAWLQ